MSSCIAPAPGDYISRLDPRTRVLSAVALSLVLSIERNPATLVTALLLALAFSAASGVFLGYLVRRMLPVNVFMLLLCFGMPLSTPGDAVFSAGPFVYTREGLAAAGIIAMKGNAIMLLLVLLLSSMEYVHLGHALERLRVPIKLTRLFLFTVRYLGVLNREYQALTRAMAVRAFRPGLNRHTLRSLGYLTGMLFVRAFDRAERIQAAMKCRGFSGAYPVLRPRAYAKRDYVVLCATCLALVVMVVS